MTDLLSAKGAGFRSLLVASIAALGIPLCTARSFAQAPEIASVEAQLQSRALARSDRYAASPGLYTYAPKAKAGERAASTVAITGHIFLEAYLATGVRTYLDKAKVAADSVIAKPDMNGNGTYGWGRFWINEQRKEVMPGDGSNTTFGIGCPLDSSKPYDDEMYDNARIGHFLLEMHRVTRASAYLDAARRMIDDTWNVGQATASGGFYYYKTVGACARGWHVKNINMLMAVPMALLAKASGERKYLERLQAMMRAERDEIRRQVGGKSAPNLGYYAVETMIEHPKQGTYVSRAQTTDLDRAITCNLRTGSGESCTTHLGLEARAIDLVLRITDQSDLANLGDIKTIMTGLEARDQEMCSAARTALGRPRSATYCVAYYCALRHFEPRYRDLCLARTADPAESSPDIILGLFWGRQARLAAAP